MIRRRYRRRNPLAFAFWGLAFCSGLAVMAWQFGWFPDASGLYELAVPGETSGESAETSALSSPAPEEPAAEEPVLFADGQPPVVGEDDVYGRMVEQARKHAERAADAPAGNREQPATASPDNRVRANTRTSLVPPQKPQRRQTAGVIRNPLYLRPQERAGGRPESGSSVVPAGNAVFAEEGNQPQAAGISDAVRRKLQEIDSLIQRDLYLSAHRELSTLYWSDPELRPHFQEQIDKTTESIYFSPQPHYMKPYVVQPGDQLRQIGQQYQLPWQYLEKLNRVDARRIRPGQELKVVKGPFSAIVELDRFEITVHAHGYYVKKYRVGIGRDGTTPLGRFTVLNKVVNPQYTGPDNRVIAADDPNNPLGERWLDLGNGYGIHGTIDPESIGRAESRGCIRLPGEDVEELYDLLGVGSVVEIRR